MTNKEFLRHLFHRHTLSLYIKNLNLTEIFSKDSSLLMKKIYRPNVQSNIKRIINILKLYNIKNLSTRDINLAMYIYKYNIYALKDTKLYLVNDDKIKELQFNLITSSEKLINCLIKYNKFDNYCILKICNRFRRYKLNLIEWENADNIYLINLYTKSYYDFQNLKYSLMKKIDREDVIGNDYKQIENIEIKQKGILDVIKELGGMEIFNNYKPKQQENNDNTLEVSYWNYITEDLKYFPYKFRLVKEHINYLKKLVYYINPSDKNLLVEMEKNLRIDMNFDTFYVIKFTDYLFCFAKKIQLKYQKDNTETFHNNMKKCMLEGEDIINFIPLSLKYLTNLFFNIWEDKILLKKSMLKLKNK